MKKVIAIFLLSLFTLNGCGAATPTAPAEVLTVEYTAATQPWLADLYGCAGENIVNSALRSVDSQDLSQANMTMRIGEVFDQNTPTYQIGMEDILVGANPKNPVKGLKLEQVRSLFGGQIRNWKDVQGDDAPVHVWVFAAGEDVEQIFEQTSLGGSPVTSTARLATGPDEMAEAIANDVNAIGIVTRRWKAAGVANLFTVASVPVLATTPTEPQGAMLQILDCLQK